MRILYNHGLSLPELFEGDTSDLTIKDLTAFRNIIGNTYEHVSLYLGEIFMSFWNMMIKDVITNKSRFQAPFNNWYVDFKILLDDEFILHRRRGRFKEIDVVESDFTGYQLTVFQRMRKGENRYREMNIYLDPKNKEKLMNIINSGEKLYSVKNTNVNTYLPKMYKMYPGFTKREIKKIVHKALSRINEALKREVYLSFANRKTRYFVGNLDSNMETHFKRFFKTMTGKHMLLAKWRQDIDFEDGIYYIGLDVKRMDDWAQRNKFAKSRFRFNEVYARKTIDVVKYNSTDIYIFKVKLDENRRLRFNYFIVDELMNDVEYVGHAINYDFRESDCTALQIKREFNEKRNG